MNRLNILKHTLLKFGLVTVLLLSLFFFTFSFVSSQNQSVVKTDNVLADTKILTILTPHSHPKTGETWRVEFKTQGKNNLFIIPQSESTIDDLKNPKLYCGDKEIKPRILKDNMLFVENWDCSSTARLENYIQKQGKHTLKFQFGSEYDFAYNTITDWNILTAGASTGIKFGTTNSAVSIAYGNGTFVVVGQNGMASYSSDGINWTVLTAGVSTGIKFGTTLALSVTYGNGTFVVVGQNGMASYSSDGINWTVLTAGASTGIKFGTSESANSVTYGNATFVVAGTGGKASYSSDGINWTVLTAGVSTGIKFGTTTARSVTYGNGTFVVVGNSGMASYSSDGINWTVLTAGASTGIKFGTIDIALSVTYGNGTFVIVGTSGMASYSSDGINWTVLTAGASTGIKFGSTQANSVTYGNGTFVVVGTSGMASYALMNANPSSPSSLGGFVSGAYTNDSTPALTFTLADTDSSDTVKYEIQIDDTSDFSSPVVDYISALASQGAASFTVGQAVGSGSYTTGSSGQTLSDGSYYWRVKAIDNSAAESAYATANSGSVAFIVDATNPSTPGTPSTSSTTTPTWSWTASTDSGSGLISTPYTVEWSTDSSFSTGVNTSTSTTNSFTHSTPLTDGTWYFRVKATDTAGNVSSYSSNGSVVVDVTSPTSIDLDSPGNNSYTDSERPTFKWKATTDATAGLSKYVLEIDNPSVGSGQVSGDFTIDNIPTSGTTDITSNNKYVIHFDGFDDSDTTNNYISVYTRSTSDWGSSENDGKVREGKVSWKVKAVDNASNETSTSRTLFVDRTNPNVEVTQLNSNIFTTNNFSTTDTTPTIFGKITDSLAGGDSSQTQTDSGPKIASGPKSIEVRIERENNFGLYDLETLATVTLNENYWSSDGTKVTDNSQNKANKYSTFSFTPLENLPLGNYRVVSTGKDNVGNTSGGTIFYLTIGTFEQVATQEQKKVQQQKQKTKEDVNITNPITSRTSPQPGFGESISKVFANLIALPFHFRQNVTRYTQEVADLGIDTAKGSIKAPKQFVSRLGNWISYSTISFGEIVLDTNPTQISDVKVEKATATSATISWKTNHLATTKVNYGLDESYGKDVQTDKRVHDHKVTITGLTPDTQYFFEVMSQGKNYVYDANRKFKTPKK